MNRTEKKYVDAIKRASRVTEARLIIKRAEDLCRRHPYQTQERILIRDMRLAIEGLLEEIEP